MNIQEKVETYLGKPVAQASDREIYDSLLSLVQEMAAGKEHKAGRSSTIFRRSSSSGSCSPIT